MELRNAHALLICRVLSPAAAAAAAATDTAAAVVHKHFMQSVSRLLVHLYAPIYVSFTSREDTCMIAYTELNKRINWIE